VSYIGISHIIHMHSHIVRMLELYHTHLNSGGVWKGQVLLKYGGYL